MKLTLARSRGRSAPRQRQLRRPTCVPAETGRIPAASTRTPGKQLLDARFVGLRQIERRLGIDHVRRRSAASRRRPAHGQFEQRLAFFTLSLKSTNSWVTVPDTWVPTLTSTTGLSVPLADTVCVTSPFSMVTSL